MSWPKVEEALELPVEELGMRVLARLAATDWRAARQWPNRNGQIITWLREWDRAGGRSRDDHEMLVATQTLGEALAEAWDWLAAEGLLARQVWINANLDAYFVTRRGTEMLEMLDPLAEIRARRRLGVELHPDLALRLKTLAQVGAFEQAALDALRQVEVRVRQLAGDLRDQRGQRLTGVPLIQRAFSEKDGVLADPHAEPGERQGLMFLFAGAFGAVRNPLSHTNVEWDDSTEAAEMVLLADLLMRQLDRVAARLEAPDGQAVDGDNTPP